MVDEMWLEAAAMVAADVDADLRREAVEVYAAEAARTRIEDLGGAMRVRVRCGHVLAGVADPREPIAEHLVLAASGAGARDHVALVVPTWAVIAVDGSAVALRDEADGPRPRSIGSWLRERWHEGDVLRILDRSGTMHIGPLSMVGADHVRLASGRCIALRAVDAWTC